MVNLEDKRFCILTILKLIEYHPIEIIYSQIPRPIISYSGQIQNGICHFHPVEDLN